MRLVEWGKPLKNEVMPLDRGMAFPQFYEDHEPFVWWNPFDWDYYFWHSMVNESQAVTGHRTIGDKWFSVMLMGGEL